jgi:competence protein ComFC
LISVQFDESWGTTMVVPYKNGFFFSTKKTRIIKMHSSLFKKILEILFPDYCVNCKNALETNEYKICDKCIEKIKKIEHTCLKCGTPLSFTQDWCSRCNNKKIFYKKLFTSYYYEKTIKKLLIQLKYDPNQKTLKNLEIFYNMLYSNLSFMSELKNLSKNIDFIIPVPIHKKRESKRGYNQSFLFANILGDILGLKINNKILKKIKNTKFFYKLSFKERQKELENAFEIIDNTSLLNKNILLVDDISTTGSTINSISKFLLEKGANNIFVFCLTHTR